MDSISGGPFCKNAYSHLVAMVPILSKYIPNIIVNMTTVYLEKQ